MEQQADGLASVTYRPVTDAKEIEINARGCHCHFAQDRVSNTEFLLTG